MPIFDTPEQISVTIELYVGNVRITATDRADTVVEVRPSNKADEADVKAAEQVTVEFSDGKLLVKSPKQPLWKQYSAFGPKGAVEVLIDLPSGSQVQGDSALGAFRCEGRLGDCRLKSALGHFQLDQTGELQLNTASGDIVIDRVNGQLNATTGSGKVDIREIAGAAVIKNSNGDTRLDEVTGNLTVKAANGDIAIRRAHGDVTAKTANGDVLVGDVGHGSVVMETALGDLEVGIRKGAAAWLDVRTKFGSVVSSLDTAQKPDPAADVVEVRARSGHGDITVRRS